MTGNVLSKKGALAALAVALAAGCTARSPSPARAAAANGAGAAARTPAPARPAEAMPEPVDLDGDGRPELVRLEVEGEAPGGARRLAGIEHDGNGDGRVDRWLSLAEDGAPATIAVDLDFDGSPDVTRWYAAGRVARSVEAIPGLPQRERTAATPDP